MLVTDQGYLKEPNVVWETLSSVDGAGHYVDHRFVTFTPASSHLEINKNSSALTTDSKHPSVAIQLSNPTSTLCQDDNSLHPSVSSKQQIDQE